MAKGLIALLVFLAVGYGLLLVISPSGVLFRKTLRKTPLAAPITVHRIEGDRLITASGSFTLAGVTLPTDSAHLARTHAFLQIATAQGIEVIRQVTPTSSILRCEPRINHWCGNDPMAAHFEQHNLNELILAMGYATHNLRDASLTALEHRRLSAACTIAQSLKLTSTDEGPPGYDRQLDHEVKSIQIGETSFIETRIRSALARNGSS
ncbi:hypothetical protein [Prosthecobacter dejongeii]|uniref:Uncharacterized protein n=1 Tax=Prosthecobacter dejongeii TaxID=48465 RepID=A0A7W7YJH3_9BACT|nr:hypothetical protein [Prosthecobacter dejongeii]MBB5037375.1 hypothetical protein [Prosthecobacter dejongeii]